MTVPLLASATWKVIVFETVSGRIHTDDLPVVGVPQFSRQINQIGSISITVQLGNTDVPPASSLRAMLAPWRFSLGVARGTIITQAGPITDIQVSATNQQVTISAVGIWGLLKSRLLVTPSHTITPTSSGSTLDLGPSGDTVYTNMALHDIAAHLVSDNLSRGTTWALPIDVPTDVGGTATRTYPLADLATVGARLQELTQVINGPDIDFKPYFDPNNPGFVRWQMRIGTPVLQQAGAALCFDLYANLESIGIDSNGALLASGVYLKGTSTTNGPVGVYSRSPTLTSVGFPELEMVDTGHTDVSDATTMQGWADGDLALYQTTVETWTALVRLDQYPDFSSYDPGTFASFVISGHFWQPDGTYQQRILGWSQGPTHSDLELVLQVEQGGI